MDIHEYQAKKILSDFGVNIPRGGIAYSPENAEFKAREIGGSKWVVKAQVHSGARGKAGGIILCKNELEVAQATDKLLGKKLVTNQTGPEGKIINRVYIEEATHIEKELYLGLVFDRSSECIMVVASTEGGMSVEEISKEKPETIIRSKIEVAVGMQEFQAREIAFGLGIDPSIVSRTAKAIIGCYRIFSELDATMVEINPLVISKDKDVLALDCKMSFDNNALFRRNNVSELRDKSQENQNEVYAADRGLNYVGLEGNIGNIINGAGLAMASMDMIKLAGGEPANFLDVGGGATPEKIVKAFKLIASDKKVKVILVNIFAGINRCDWVAEGIVLALQKIKINMPLIIRLAGTNVDEGNKILANSGIDYISASTLEDAANKAVEALNKLEFKP
jgi:malate-CoA ligase subunit beta